MGKKRSLAGTLLHKNIEMFLNARGDFAWDGELLQFRQWLEDVVVVRRWVPFRTEWSIFDDVHLIAGQIDSLWLDPQGSIVFTLILTVCLTVCALCFSLLGLALVYPSANDSGFRTLLSGYALNSKTVDGQGKQAHVQSHTHTHICVASEALSIWSIGSAVGMGSVHMKELAGVVAVILPSTT